MQNFILINGIITNYQLAIALLPAVKQDRPVVVKRSSDSQKTTAITKIAHWKMNMRQILFGKSSLTYQTLVKTYEQGGRK